MNIIASRLINFVFPLTCAVCKTPLSHDDKNKICDDCLNKMKYIEPLFCVKCGIPLVYGGAHCYNCLHPEKKQYYEKIRGVFEYEGVIKQCVHLFKYGNKEYLAEYFSGALADYIEKEKELDDFGILVPVPLHWYKKFKRGYNQSELLVKKTAGLTGRVFSTDNLFKRKYTESQANLNRNGRLMNVEDAFAVRNPEVFRKKNIILVDDVCTTGETLNQCAKALVKAHSGKVYGLTLARDT